MAAKVPPFSELIAATSVSAVHLEMRDQYTPDDPVFLGWLATGHVADPAEPDWYGLVRAQVGLMPSSSGTFSSARAASGVRTRGADVSSLTVARIVSGPD